MAGMAQEMDRGRAAIYCCAGGLARDVEGWDEDDYCDGARAMLVSSESRVSRGHKYRSGDEIGPAGRECGGGWVGAAWCPGLARGFAVQSAENMLAVARVRKEPPLRAPS